ncbi:MAG: hypothetical protein QNJ54_01970 [Prochloraceae cyanobacterium]|nr:hypothetical protein [Prochloraceae cyanobacterium]
MGHSFLMEGGLWRIEGKWLERQVSIPVRGKIVVTWDEADWFTMVTKLIFPDSDRQEISYRCRGRLNRGERQYSYALKQNILGRIEGEGWLADRSIVQRYWVLSDPSKRTGFETFYQLEEDTYHLCGGILAGHYITSTIEALLKRQA